MICRVFQKTSGGKKIHISGIVKMSSFDSDLDPSGLPPLMDSSPSNGGKTRPMTSESAYVPCFSNPMNLQRNQEELLNAFNNSLLTVSSNPSDNFPRMAPSNLYYSAGQVAQIPAANLQYPNSFVMQDQTILRALLENNGSNMRQHFKTEREMISVSQETGLTTDMNPEISSVMSNLDMGRRPFEDQEGPSSSAVPIDLDCLWNY